MTMHNPISNFVLLSHLSSDPWLECRCYHQLRINIRVKQLPLAAQMVVGGGATNQETEKINKKMEVELQSYKKVKSYQIKSYNMGIPIDEILG